MVGLKRYLYRAVIPYEALKFIEWLENEGPSILEQKDTTMELPKMQNPYLTVAQAKLIFDLPKAVNNFLAVWKPKPETRSAFRYLVCTEHRTAKAFELLNTTRPRAVPDFLFEYSRREQAEWILELSSYPHPNPEMRRAESIVVIAGQIQKFLDMLYLPRMGGDFKRNMHLRLLAAPIRDLRAGLLKSLYECVGFEMAKTAHNGECEFTCVIPRLYELLKAPEGMSLEERSECKALQVHNFTLIREARDRVLPGWDEIEN